jgi:hypothetical protein
MEEKNSVESWSVDGGVVSEAGDDVSVVGNWSVV